MKTRSALTALCTVALAALSLAVALPSASAQSKVMEPKMAPKMDHKMSGKKMDHKMMKAPVYVCKECKMYYSEADAKKMKMMDAKGHKMVKMEKAPMGYTMGHMGKKMMDHKMSGGKMSGGKTMEPKMPAK